MAKPAGVGPAGVGPAGVGPAGAGPELLARSALLASLALLVNAFVWGVSWWPFRQLETAGLHPLWATALVYGFGLIFLWALHPRAWVAFGHTPGLWLLAMASGMTNLGFNWAVTTGDVVRVVLLFYLMPGWVVLLAWPLLGEKPRPAALMRLALALAGVLVVLKTPGTAWPMPQSLPDYLALLGGFSFALTNIMLRKLSAAPSASRMLGMFAGGTLFAAAVAAWGSSAGWVTPLPAPSSAWVPLAGLLALAFLLGNMALQYGASRLPATTTSLIMLSEVLFASASAVWLGAGTLQAHVLLGGALIVAAALWAAWSDR